MNTLLKDIQATLDPNCEIQKLKKDTGKYEDNKRFTRFKGLFENVNILNDSQKALGARLTYCIHEATDVQPDILSFKGEFEKISTFARFFKTILKKKLYVVIDSVDENNYFFDDGKYYFNELKSFVNSFVNSEFLNLAFGEEELKAFEILVFLPIEKEGNNFKLNWTRVDKIPINYMT